MAHTPGPWKYAKNQGEPEVGTEDGIRLICKVMGLGSVPNENGNLISAAPDLLKAAEMALSALEFEYNRCGHSSFRPDCTQCHLAKAIFKAKGIGIV